MDPRVVSMFYMVVEQAVLFFGLETWILLAVMESKVEGIKMFFKMKITGNQA